MKKILKKYLLTGIISFIFIIMFINFMDSGQNASAMVVLSLLTVIWLFKIYCPRPTDKD
jgi:hypothetical protein